MFYKLLDVFFLTFHSALILFNVFGWIPRKTRPWNLLTLLLTVASWTILGYFHGWGYCFCTDWHWQVLRELGWTELPNSYVAFLFQRLLNLKVSLELVDGITLFFFSVSLVLSAYLNYRDWKIK